MTEAGWFVARGTGVMALILLSVVVVLGVGSRSGRPAFGLPRFAVSLVHRNAALLSIGLLTVHVVTLLFDPYAKLRVYDLFVPFGAEYRPLYMGLGTMASDVMLVLVVTSLLRRHLRPRLWRALHWLAYASWPAAFGHSIGTGTDSGERWMVAVSAACLLAVLGALGWRFVLWLRPRPRQPGATVTPARRAPDAVPAGNAALPRPAASATTDDVGARSAQQWSYPSTTGGHLSPGTAPSAGYAGSAGSGYAASTHVPDDCAPPTSGYATATTSGSLLDMYRKPAASYPPASASAPADEGSGAFAGYGQPTYAEEADASYVDADMRGAGYLDPGYAPAGYAEPGPAFQSAAVPASEPDWQDDLRYQPAAEYVAMYRGEGYDPVGSAYPAAGPIHGTGTDPYAPGPVAVHDAPDTYGRSTYPPAGDSNGYREDPHSVSSGWRR